MSCFSKADISSWRVPASRFRFPVLSMCIRHTCIQFSMCRWKGTQKILSPNVKKQGVWRVIPYKTFSTFFRPISSCPRLLSGERPPTWQSAVWTFPEKNKAESASAVPESTFRYVTTASPFLIFFLLFPFGTALFQYLVALLWSSFPDCLYLHPANAQIIGSFV